MSTLWLSVTKPCRKRTATSTVDVKDVWNLLTGFALSLVKGCLQPTVGFVA
jgi:hypothetical protein